MKRHSTSILAEFDSSKFLLQEFGEVVYTLTKSLVKESINPHQINFRIKDRDSLANKLLKKNNKYTELKEITDLVGLRIITYFEDDIDNIAEIFKKEFEIDFPNSADKRQVDSDKFGYRSLHYVASLNKERAKLTEYKKYKGIKFEVQIRSILQHSWAEIEHDLGYKGESEIPKTAKRTFYRVAALLEQADIEFVKLRQLIQEHETTIKGEILESKPETKIDLASIIAFIKESTTLKEIEKEIELKTCERGSYSDATSIANTILERLKNHKIHTLFDLEKLLIDNKENIINWNISYYFSMPEPRPNSFIAGAAIIWMFNHIEGVEPKFDHSRRITTANKVLAKKGRANKPQH
jgi:putative GTP pyrophosphokinase